MGSENNFFGMDDIKQNAFTMTSIDDAIILRNHIINVLEQINLERDNLELRKALSTFVVVGGGFNGVETVGELNHFVRDSIQKYHKNIYMSHVRIRVIGDWTLDLIFKPDVAMIKRSDMKANNTDNVRLQMSRNKSELSRTEDL